MAWSKVDSEYKKPLIWWIHKVLCEYGWLVRNKDNFATYSHHLNQCIKYGFNLYGKKI